MKIDAHVHLVRFSQTKDPIKDFHLAAQNCLEEMKLAGIDQAIVMPDRKKPDQFAIDMESGAQVLKDYPTLHLVGTFDVFKNEKAELARVEKLLATGQIVGVKLYPGYQHFFPNDFRCTPIYEMCQKYKRPVIFHSGDTTSLDFPVKLKYTHPLEIDDVAADWPHLKIVIAHVGNPWLVDCAEVMYKNPNVYADFSGLLSDESGPESDYTRLLKRKLEELMIYASPNKLIYGSDWPVTDMVTYVKFAQNLGIPAQAQEKVYYQNAVEVFGLKALSSEKKSKTKTPVPTMVD